jgi:hypothetical protein
MTWYRYWLELRPRLLMVAVFALWTGISMPEWAKLSPAAAKELLGTPLAQSIGLESLNAWSAFAGQMAFFAWVVGVCLTGNGVGTAFMRRHASVSYTLTLPVSRSRLISTHQASNCAAAFLAAVLALAAQCATLWLRGEDVPIIPLAMSIAFATLFVIAWIALLSALSMVMHEGWAILVGVPLFVVSVRWNWVTVTALPAYSEFPWVSVAALLAISTLALAFSLSMSRIQEFG